MSRTERAGLAPLRKVVSVSDNGWIVRETLECGHTIRPSFTLGAKRRRCRECFAYQRTGAIGVHNFARHHHGSDEHGHDGGWPPHVHDSTQSVGAWPGTAIPIREFDDA